MSLKSGGLTSLSDRSRARMTKSLNCTSSPGFKEGLTPGAMVLESTVGELKMMVLQMRKTSVSAEAFDPSKWAIELIVTHSAAHSAVQCSDLTLQCSILPYPTWFVLSIRLHSHFIGDGQL